LAIPVGVKAFPVLLAAACLALETVAAQADWRDDTASLRIGVLAESNAAYRVAQLQPFRSYLEERLGLPVDIVPEPDYAALIEAQASGKVQYAIHSAASFATALAGCRCVEAIAVPKAADGAIGFYSVLVVKAGSPIKALADARGARLAVGGDNSVAGRLLPMRAFTHDGIAPEKFFASLVPASDPQEAIASLFTGKADAALSWSSMTGPADSGYDFGVLTNMIGDGRLQPATVRVVWQSPLIPFGPHVVRSDMPPELKGLISDALLAIASDAPDALDAVDRAGYGGGGFAVPEPGIYAPIAELVSAPAGATP
jgi:phosphonate transport system substrate-binding protein